MTKEAAPLPAKDAVIERNTLLDRLLVEGEMVQDNDGKPMRVYPMSNEIATRLGVTPSWVSKFARTHRCFQRRAELKAKIEAQARDELVRHEAKRVAFDTERTLRLCDTVLSKYEEAITEHGVGRITSADINTIVRLRRYLMGDADTRQEVRSQVSLEDMQSAHRQLLVDVQNMTRAECGIEDGAAEEPRAPSFDEVNSGGEVDRQVDQEEAQMDVH
jgi:hypothetical protein